MTEKVQLKFTRALGRRKGASARVRLFKGRGQSLVNGKAADSVYSLSKFKVKYMKPFVLGGLEEKYYFTAKVNGSGVNSQVDALTLGLARALVLCEKDMRVVYRKEGLLTRDSRERQRRMIGMGGKARRKKQSPKR